MQNKTTEFSFILKPSKYGVGVFAVHDIKTGIHLRLFGEENEKVSIMRKKEAVPKLFRDYCPDRGEFLCAPKDFGCMEIGWYLNHSKNPNAYHKNYNRQNSIRSYRFAYKKRKKHSRK